MKSDNDKEQEKQYFYKQIADELVYDGQDYAMYDNCSFSIDDLEKDYSITPNELEEVLKNLYTDYDNVVDCEHYEDENVINYTRTGTLENLEEEEESTQIQWQAYRDILNSDDISNKYDEEKRKAVITIFDNVSLIDNMLSDKQAHKTMNDLVYDYIVKELERLQVNEVELQI